MASVWDYDDFEVDVAFRAKWQPVLDEIEAEKLRFADYAVRGEKPAAGSWLPIDYMRKWVPVRPATLEMQKQFDAALKAYEIDWLKARLKRDKEKRNTAVRVPDFDAEDRSDVLARAMAVAAPHDVPMSVRLLPYRQAI